MHDDLRASESHGRVFRELAVGGEREMNEKILVVDDDSGLTTLMWK